MSFFLTERQLIAGHKTQTRRLGWRTLRQGDVLKGVSKAMGLKRGERQHVISMIRVTAVRFERLDAITQADVDREGMPHMTPAEFVAFFCRANECTPDREVTVIDFEKVPD